MLRTRLALESSHTGGSPLHTNDPKQKALCNDRRAPRRQPSPRTANYACDFAPSFWRCKYTLSNLRVIYSNCKTVTYLPKNVEFPRSVFLCPTKVVKNVSYSTTQ